MIHASANTESIVASTLFRPLFSHSLDPKRKSVVAPVCELAVGSESRYTRSTSRPRGRGHVAKKKVTRKLAAILATDMVGFSRLMEKDEAGTLAHQKALRKRLIDLKIAKHKGRIVRSAGGDDAGYVENLRRRPVASLAKVSPAAAGSRARSIGNVPAARATVGRISYPTMRKETRSCNVF